MVLQKIMRAPGAWSCGVGMQGPPAFVSHVREHNTTRKRLIKRYTAAVWKQDAREGFAH